MEYYRVIDIQPLLRYFVTLLEQLARWGHIGRKCLIKNAPLSHVPFLIYFGHDIDWETVAVGPLRYGLWKTLEKEDVKQWISEAQEKGCFRDLIETFAAFTPLGSDILMRADRKGWTTDHLLEGKKNLVISSFHAYDRSYVRETLDEMSNFKTQTTKEKCVLLPCAARRPYFKSQKHKKLYAEIGSNIDEYYKVVITTIGAVPEEFWEHPLVLSYENHYPDLWDVYLRCKKFFVNNKDRFKEIRNFHRYEPFLEIIKMCGIDTPTEAGYKKSIV